VHNGHGEQPVKVTLEPRLPDLQLLVRYHCRVEDQAIVNMQQDVPVVEIERAGRIWLHPG